MMGIKTLREIREELRAALAADGDDPIEWLDKRIRAAKRKGEGTDVLEAVKQVLERGIQKKTPKRQGKRPARAKKRQAIVR